MGLGAVPNFLVEGCTDERGSVCVGIPILSLSATLGLIAFEKLAVLLHQTLCPLASPRRRRRLRLLHLPSEWICFG